MSDVADSTPTQASVPPRAAETTPPRPARHDADGGDHQPGRREAEEERFGGIEVACAFLGWLAATGMSVVLLAVLAVLVLALIAAIAGTRSGLLAQVSVPSLPINASNATLGSIISVAAVAIVALVGAILGGLAGMRSHHRTDRAGLGGAPA